MSYQDRYELVNKLRIFIQQCDSVAQKYRGDIDGKILLDRLCILGFSRIEGMEYILMAENNGQIYERRPGVWARA